MWQRFTTHRPWRANQLRSHAVLCAGGAAELLRSGATDLGGRISVNPSGGLLSRGHPIGATGTAQIFELVHQLRGEAGARQRESAKVAVAQNSGGRLAEILLQRWSQSSYRRHLSLPA